MTFQDLLLIFSICGFVVLTFFAVGLAGALTEMALPSWIQKDPLHQPDDWKKLVGCLNAAIIGVGVPVAMMALLDWVLS